MVLMQRAAGNGAAEAEVLFIAKFDHALNRCLPGIDGKV